MADIDGYDYYGGHSDMWSNEELIEEQKIMSANAQGVVQFLSEKNGRFSIKMKDVWYGFGKYKPACNEGDTVSFTFDKNGEWMNGDARTLTVVAAAGTGAAQPAVPSGNTARQASKGAVMTKDDYWGRKEVRDLEVQNVIQYQAARNSAISVCAALLANDALPLGSAKGKQVGVFMAAIQKVTDQFYADAKTQGPQDMVDVDADAVDTSEED